MIVKIDFSDWFGEVQDQKNLPACLAFAASSANEYLHGLSKLLCVNWLFFHAKNYEDLRQDGGANIPNIAKTLQQKGQPFENVWPYEGTSEIEDQTPPQNPRPRFCAEGIAALFAFHKIVTRLHTQHPTVIAFEITEDFSDANDQSGFAKVEQNTHSRKLGWHAILAVGYGTMNGKQYLKVRNSWGPWWGADGYAWVCEDYFNANATLMLWLQNGRIVQ